MPRRRPGLAFIATLLVQLLSLSLVQAQLIANSLPACAKQCSLLVQAQASCETNPASAQSCFCQSSLLAPLKSSTSNICAPNCDQTDFNSIAAWYKSTCASGAQAPAGQSPTPTTTTATSPSAANNGVAAATTAAATGSSPVNQNQTGTEWWDSHWQWIVMLLVLVFGFLTIGLVGRHLYRRRHKKVDGEIVESTPDEQPPDMGMWAPSRHSVHDFSPAADRERPLSTVAPLPTRQLTNSKGKHREGTRPAMPARTPSQRLKAAMEQVQM